MNHMSGDGALKSCPLCGGERIAVRRRWFCIHQAHCTTCGYSGNQVSRIDYLWDSAMGDSDAANAWNFRPDVSEHSRTKKTSAAAAAPRSEGVLPAVA